MLNDFRQVVKMEVSPSAVNASDTVAALEKFYLMAAHLHRGGEWRYLWTPNGGEECDKKRTDWRPVTANLRPATAWMHGKNVYFGVNPVTAKRRDYERATNATVAAINCLYAELDGKDYVTQAEWQGYYVTPNLDEYATKARKRGALQRAQTAAIDAAYKANPDEYKRRALAALTGSALRASYAWDSGGGYQAVWLLAETVTVDDANRDRLKHLQRGWVHTLGGDGAASDLARVLRVPGTRNYKPKYAPNYPEVAYLWAEHDRQYSLDDFKAIVPSAAAKAKAVRQRVFVPAGVAPDLAEFGDVPVLPNHPSIHAYNAETNLRDLLLEIGYTQAAAEDRMNRPGGDSAGVQLHEDNTATIYSSGDPLFCEHRVTPAHALCVYEYNGNVDAMLTALTGVQYPLPLATQANAYSLIQWAQSAAARELLRDGYGIRRPAGYLRTIEALLLVAMEKGRWLLRPGTRDLAERSNASPETISNHLQWLNGSFFQVWHTDGADYVDLGLLASTLKLTGTPIRHAVPVNDSVDGDRGGDEIGDGGAVNFSVDTDFQIESLPFDGFVPAAYTHAIRRRLSPTVLLPSLGHDGRPIWAYLLENAGVDRLDIAQATGISIRTVQTVMQRMERLHLVLVEQEGRTKYYTLAENARETMLERLPDMTCYMIGTRRAEVAENSRALWLAKAAKNAKTPQERAKIEAMRLQNDVRQDTLRAALIEVGIRPAKVWTPQRSRFDDLEMAAQHRSALKVYLSICEGTHYEKQRMMEIAGWTTQDIHGAMKLGGLLRGRAAEVVADAQAE